MGPKHLDTWLAGYDPIHRGWTPAGIANGLCTTSGFFFPRTSGGYNLYRSVGGTPDSSAELVGAAEADASRIQTFPWVVHARDTQYHYRLVPVGGGGVENWTDVTMTSVFFDAAGDWTGTLPNAPTDLRLIPLGSGRFAVRWTYLPQGQEAEPSLFNLYSNPEGDVDIDYSGIFGSLMYRPGQVHYEYITLPEPDGRRVGWAVRTLSEALREEANTNQAFGVARSQAPPVNPVVVLSVV